MPDFTVRGYASGAHPNVPQGQLLVETTHKGEVSAYVTVEAWQSRMRGADDVDHAELIDHRPGAKLTILDIGAYTPIPWSWVKEKRCV